MKKSYSGGNDSCAYRNDRFEIELRTTAEFRKPVTPRGAMEQKISSGAVDFAGTVAVGAAFTETVAFRVSLFEVAELPTLGAGDI